MLTGLPASKRQRTTKATTIAIGIVFAILAMSLVVGLRTSNAALPVAPAAKGCHTGGGEGDDVAAMMCTTSTTSPTSTSTVTTSTTTVSTFSTVSTTSDQSGSNPVSSNALADCGSLNGIGYQALTPGTALSITVNGKYQMTFTVPKEASFSWMWYWVPANGQSTSTLGQQVTSALWASGHGQDFTFFVAQLNGQTGLVLQTDYALSQACG
jgi:hypothetical protein